MTDDPTSAGSGRALAGAAMVCGVLAVGVVPVILGPIGLALGYAAYSRSARLGTWGMVIAGIGTVVGLVLEAIISA